VLQDVLTYQKSLDACKGEGTEADEYLDAFVFLGGSPDKEGCVSKDLLIAVIKEEFGLTIDMVVSNFPFTNLRFTPVKISYAELWIY